jgi:hypothetical protein
LLKVGPVDGTLAAIVVGLVKFAARGTANGKGGMLDA